MIHRLSNIFYTIATMMLVVLTGCADDLDLGPNGYGNGTARVKVVLDYMPVVLSEITTSRAISDSTWAATQAPPGNGFDITEATKGDVNLKLFVYNTTEEVDNALVKVIDIDPANMTIANPVRTGDQADEESDTSTKTSDPTTGQITTTIDLEYGRYYIYAVAYAGDITAKDAPNVNALRSVKRNWVNNNYKANREMFGVVTNQGESRPSLEENRAVIVNRPSVELHSWLRRLVSKVTISFDGSGLRENVFVYLRRATVHNIANHCRLGVANDTEEIKTKDDVLTNFEGNVESEGGDQDLHPKNSAHYIQYFNRNSEHPTATGDWAMHLYWPSVSAGNPKFAEEDHAHDAKSLTFYENMQGVKAKPGKKQIVDDPLSGTLEFYEKDDVKLGTYIEVEAYYVSGAENNITEGKIFYRFMLGKNDIDDFNAQRNHHFKLTLRLRGNANEYDWHVDYKEDVPTIQVSSPFYVSYLPNQSGHMNFKINTGTSWELTELKSEIVASSWLPQESGVTADEYAHYTSNYGNADNNVAIKYKPDGITEVEYKDINPHYGDDGKEILIQRDKFYGTTKKYLSFLSLVPVPYHSIMGKATGADREGEQNKVGDFLNSLNFDNRTYEIPESSKFGEFTKQCDYTGKKGDGNDTYQLYADISAESYSDEYNYNHILDAYGNHTYSYNVPIYTNAKVLASGSTYSGYNPFVSSERHAYVKLSATVRKIGSDERRTIEQIVKVIQVPRLTNPLAIWRKHNNKDPFKVTLMRQNSRLSDFTPVISNGSWTADIYRAYPDNNNPWFKLEVTEGSNATKDAYGVIHGKSGSKVEFKYDPSSTCEETEIRAGVIRITYHNDNCVHYVYVRQGYAAAQIVSNGANWSCFNLYDSKNLCASPLSIGSYFKGGNLSLGIKESNNDSYGFDEALDSVVCTDGKNYTWSTIKSKQNIYLDDVIFNNSDLGISGYSFPTYSNYEKLMAGCVSRFGIAYDDNSTGVATDIDDARGFTDYNNNGTADQNEAVGATKKNFGVRCALVANKDFGRNLIFPLSSLGYGRRRQSSSGQLHYGGLTKPWPNTTHRPFVYVNYRCFGAIYWYSNVNNNRAGWDINYSDLNFESYNYEVITTSGKHEANTDTDALPIKLLKN